MDLSRLKFSHSLSAFSGVGMVWRSRSDFSSLCSMIWNLRTLSFMSTYHGRGRSNWQPQRVHNTLLTIAFYCVTVVSIGLKTGPVYAQGHSWAPPLSVLYLVCIETLLRFFNSASIEKCKRKLKDKKGQKKVSTSDWWYYKVQQSVFFLHLLCT